MMFRTADDYEAMALAALENASSTDVDGIRAYYIGVAQTDATLALASATEALRKVTERSRV